MSDLRLLQEVTERRRRGFEALRQATRKRLRCALHEVLPAGFEVVVFGSLCRKNAFGPTSDADVAVASFPNGMTLTELTAELSTRLGRDVDVVLLPRSRFREAILRTGELWTVSE